MQALIAILPTAPILSAVRDATHSGMLARPNYTWGEPLKGNEQFSDSVLLGSLVNDDRPFTQRLVGARLLIRKGNGDYDPTPDLVDYAEGRISADTTHPRSRTDRYWYGARLYPALALQVLSFAVAKHLLHILAFVSPFALVLATRGLTRACRVAAWAISVASVSVGPPLFYGATFTHGVPFVFSMFGTATILWLLRRANPLRRDLVLGGGGAVLGVLGHYFDLLDGGVWFPFWLLVMLVPLASAERPSARPWRDTLYSAGSFSAGVIASVMAKYLITAVEYEQFSMGDFVAAASYRLGAGQSISLSTVAGKLFQSARWIGFGFEGLGRVVLLLILALAAFALVSAWMNAVCMRRRGARFTAVWTTVTILGSLGWYVLVRNHTQVHAWFLLPWIFLTAAAAVVGLVFVFLPSRQIEDDGDKSRQNA